MSTIACVVPAGGVGIRMGIATPKQLLLLHGKSILAHTLSNLRKVSAVDLIVVVTSLPLLEKIQTETDKVLEEWSVSMTGGYREIASCESHVLKYVNGEFPLSFTSEGCPIEVIVRKGVDSRHASIKTGVDHLKGRGIQTVIVHDAVRPLVPRKVRRSAC